MALRPKQFSTASIQLLSQVEISWTLRNRQRIWKKLAGPIRRYVEKENAGLPIQIQTAARHTRLYTR